LDAPFLDEIPRASRNTRTASVVKEIGYGFIIDIKGLRAIEAVWSMEAVGPGTPVVGYVA
jgi:hypothetical protein